MSRTAKYGSRRARTNKTRQHEARDKTYTGEEENGLPPRRQIHPSNKHQTAQLFYNALIFIFFILIVALFWFGKQSYQAS